MKNSSKLLTLFVALFCQATWAQNQDVEMADVMRSNGKIYVVIAIILVIFTGMVTYLIAMDRKVTRLEKKIEKKA